MSDHPAGPLCPKCKRDFVLRVRAEGALEGLAGYVFVYPFRCQLCGDRFLSGQFGVRAPVETLERRQYVRVKVRFPVTIAGEARGEGSLIDISLGGCAIETDANLGTGRVLRLKLHPTEADPPIIVEAAAVRSVRGAIVGVEFLRLTPDQRSRLVKVVAGLHLAQRK